MNFRHDHSHEVPAISVLNIYIYIAETPPSSPKTISTSDNFPCRVTMSVMNRVIADSFSSWASMSHQRLSSSITGTLSEQQDDSAEGGGGGDSCPLHHKVIITALARLTKQCTAAHFPIQQVSQKLLRPKDILDEREMRKMLV